MRIQEFIYLANKLLKRHTGFGIELIEYDYDHFHTYKIKIAVGRRGSYPYEEAILEETVYYAYEIPSPHIPPYKRITVEPLILDYEISDRYMDVNYFVQDVYVKLQYSRRIKYERQTIRSIHLGKVPSKCYACE